MLVDDQVTLAIQVNGKLRDTLDAPRGLDRAAAEALALGVGKGAASARWQRAAKGNRGSGPAGEHRRMMRRFAHRRSRCAWPACQLRPLYARRLKLDGGHDDCGRSRWRRSRARSGWLVYNKLKDRLGASGSEKPGYRLNVELDDDIVGFGMRGDRAVTRERRSLRARYQLVDVTTGAVVLDATAGSDAGIDVVSSEYATVAAEQTAPSGLSEGVADQIVARLGLFATRTRGASK